MVLVRDRDLAVGQAAPDLLLRDPVVLVALVRDRDLADLGGRAARGLALRHLADRARRGKDPPDLAAGVDLAVPVDLVDQADLDTVDLADQGLLDREPRGLAGPVDLDPAARVDLDLADRVHQAMVDRSVRVGLANLDLADLVVQDPVGQVDPVDPRRRPTLPRALTTGAARKWADPPMRLVGSAHPTTVRRPRPRNTDSGGTAGLLQGRRRQTGTVRRLPVAGTGRRLLVVGTADGTVRHAT